MKCSWAQADRAPATALAPIAQAVEAREERASSSADSAALLRFLFACSIGTSFLVLAARTRTAPRMTERPNTASATQNQCMPRESNPPLPTPCGLSPRGNPQDSSRPAAKLEILRGGV